ncbi:MAG: hypothetical protein ACXW02_06830 [Halobacteriota archaeon]
MLIDAVRNLLTPVVIFASQCGIDAIRPEADHIFIGQITVITGQIVIRLLSFELTHHGWGQVFRFIPQQNRYVH